MLTDEQIRMAWLLILGREPENEGVYQANRTHTDMEALRRQLLQSPEFRQKYAQGTKSVGQLRLATNPVSPACAKPDVLQRMFERIQEEWTKLGEEEPYWSVLTSPRYKLDAFEENRDEFFRSGISNVDLVKAALARNNLVAKPDGICMELGCGVGRVSVQLAGMFGHVHGYDIAPGNLALAERNASEFGVTNTSFHLLRSIADYDRLERYDFFFSVIVLQHNPPPVQRAILEKIIARAKPGAVLFFQVPTYASRYRFDAETYLDTPVTKLEMHVLPQSDIFDALSAGKCRVVEVMEDASTGHAHADWLSMTFVAQKR